MLHNQLTSCGPGVHHFFILSNLNTVKTQSFYTEYPGVIYSSVTMVLVTRMIFLIDQ